MNVFVVDIAKCNGCHNCQIACKDEHCGTSWLPYAQSQPETGHFWTRVEEKVRGSVPVVKISYTPLFCNHCEDAPCMKAAPEAIYRRNDGLVIIDPAKAKGAKKIVDACPIGAIYWNEELSLPQKCTGCAHLLDAGWTVPRCVDACATEALRYGPAEDFEGELQDATILEGLIDCMPKVFYLNMPKRFAAGSLVDFRADEVVADAAVEIIDNEGRVVESMRTDDMGDFYFPKIEPGHYTMKASKAGYEAIQEELDLTELDVCLGDLRFEAI